MRTLLRLIPAIVLALVVGALATAPSVAAAESATPTGSHQKAPKCMKQATYKKIKKGMKYSKVKDIIKGQKAAYSITGIGNPYFIYKGCAWTNGKGVLLQYTVDLFAPLKNAKLDKKSLNPCGTAPACARTPER